MKKLTITLLLLTSFSASAGKLYLKTQNKKVNTDRILVETMIIGNLSSCVDEMEEAGIELACSKYIKDARKFGMSEKEIKAELRNNFERGEAEHVLERKVANLFR